MKLNLKVAIQLHFETISLPQAFPVETMLRQNAGGGQNNRDSLKYNAVQYNNTPNYGLKS